MPSPHPSLTVSPSPPQRLPEWIRPAYALPLLALAVTCQLWRSAQQNAVQMLQAQFDFRVRDTADDITKRMLPAAELVVLLKDGL